MNWTLDPTASTLEVWTYKAGLLSRVAHDLCFRAQGPSLEVEVNRQGDQLSVESRIAVQELQLRGQVMADRIAPMKPRDAAEIRKNMLGERVLAAHRHPRVTFRGQGAVGPELTLSGELDLRGVVRPLTVRAVWNQRDGCVTVRGEVVLQPTNWGIEPYSALLGALRLKDEVRLTWSLRLAPVGI